MKEPMQVVMVEHIGDTGNWEWYEVVRDSTPEKEVLKYIEEILGDEEDRELEAGDSGDVEGTVYSKNQDVRAYYITI